jgi:hypothetical protein
VPQIDFPVPNVKRCDVDANADSVVSRYYFMIELRGDDNSAGMYTFLAAMPHRETVISSTVRLSSTADWCLAGEVDVEERESLDKEFFLSLPKWSAISMPTSYKAHYQP